MAKKKDKKSSKKEKEEKEPKKVKKSSKKKTAKKEKEEPKKKSGTSKVGKKQETVSKKKTKAGVALSTEWRYKAREAAHNVEENYLILAESLYEIRKSAAYRDDYGFSTFNDYCFDELGILPG